MRILAVDGALANAALALVATGVCPERPDPRDSLRIGQAAHGLVATARVSTPSTASTLERCRTLRAWIAHQVSVLLPDVVLFEVPARDGAYAHVRRRQTSSSQLNARSEAMLNRGIGALAAGVPEGIPVLEILAGQLKKEQRRAIVNAALRQAGRAELRNEHEIDAAYYALSWAGAHLARTQPQGRAG